MSEIRDSDLDRWYVDPQDTDEEDEPVCKCDICEELIYEDEWVWKFPDYGCICENCIDNFKFTARK